MNERVWKSGPPPHVGWWNAMRADAQDTPLNTHYWHWWDGEHWSMGAFANCSAGSAYVSATSSWKNNAGIEWTDYYPEGARVPRVDPSDPKNAPVVAYINATGSASMPGVWEKAAWEMYRRHQAQADAAAAGSTRLVREMKERMKPMPTMHIPSTAPDREKVVVPAPPPGYVPGSRQRLSEAVRVGDVDFSGAMGRNQDPDISRLRRRADPSGAYTHLRGRVVSNGQQNPERREIDDHFAPRVTSVTVQSEEFGLENVSVEALLKEVLRRLG